MAKERPALFPIFLSSLHHRAANTCASRRDLEAFVRNNEKVIPYGMFNRMITMVRCIPRHKIAECLEGMNDFPHSDDVALQITPSLTTSHTHVKDSLANKRWLELTAMIPKTVLRGGL